MNSCCSMRILEYCCVMPFNATQKPLTVWIGTYPGTAVGFWGYLNGITSPVSHDVLYQVFICDRFHCSERAVFNLYISIQRQCCSDSKEHLSYTFTRSSRAGWVDGSSTIRPIRGAPSRLSKVFQGTSCPRGRVGWHPCGVWPICTCILVFSQSPFPKSQHEISTTHRPHNHRDTPIYKRTALTKAMEAVPIPRLSYKTRGLQKN